MFDQLLDLEYSHFDYWQNVKHLLAIYNHWRENKTNKKHILLNVLFKIDDDNLKNDSEKYRETMATSCKIKTLFEEHMELIGVKFEFRCESYDEVLSELPDETKDFYEKRYKL